MVSNYLESLLEIIKFWIWDPEVEFLKSIPQYPVTCYGFGNSILAAMRQEEALFGPLAPQWEQCPHARGLPEERKDFLNVE